MPATDDALTTAGEAWCFYIAISWHWFYIIVYPPQDLCIRLYVDYCEISVPTLDLYFDKK